MRRAVAGLLSLCLAALLGLAVLSAFAERLLIADIVQQGRAHLAVAAMLGVGLAILLRRRRQALAALGLAVLLGWPVVDSALPHGWPEAAAPSGAEPSAASASGAPPRHLTLVTANVYIDNASPEAMIETLLGTGAEILVLIEFQESWRGAAQRLRARYPHSWRVGDVTVWSRFPASGGAGAVRAREFTLDVVLDLEGRELRLLATHAPRPPDLETLAERNWLFSELRAWTRETSLPTVIAGDLNATPWTPALRRVLADPAIGRARPRGGWYASWPAPLGDLGMPIDHLLHSGPVAVERTRLLTVPGSDHRAIRTRLSLP